MNIEIIEYKDYCASVNVSMGANCISLLNTKYNADILRTPDYSTEIDNPFLYGAPILFPVNRISDGKFEFENRIYKFPINEVKTKCTLHGTLHSMPFEVINKAENKIVCEYRATNDKPYLTFPHEFNVVTTYELGEKGLYHKTEIINKSKENMPVFIGFHTTFNLPFTKNCRTEDLRIYVEIANEYERNLETYLPTGRIINMDKVSNSLTDGTFCAYKNPISRHYRAGKNGIMKIMDIKNKISVIYNVDESLLYRLIFGCGTDFICMEPQNCVVNCANLPIARNETGFEYIEPGCSKIYSTHIGIVESI